jgi:hypothetical protein
VLADDNCDPLTPCRRSSLACYQGCADSERTIRDSMQEILVLRGDFEAKNPGWSASAACWLLAALKPEAGAALVRQHRFDLPRHLAEPR